MKAICFIKEWKKSLTKNKTWYFHGNLVTDSGDKFGFKLWNRGTEDDKPDLPPSGFYEIGGSVDDWGSLIIHGFSQRSPDEITLSDFMAKPPYEVDPVAIKGELLGYVFGIKNRFLKELVIVCLSSLDAENDGTPWDNGFLRHSDEFLMSDAAAYNANFATMWGAVHNHHAYIHGFMLHTLEVLKVSLALFDSMIGPYGVNEEHFGSISTQREILIAAAIIHDIGKGFENESDGVSFSKTAYGELCGNELDISLEYIQEMFLSSGVHSIEDYSVHIYIHLRKCIRGHHGGYGNQLPNTFIAQCLSFADGSSSHLAKIRDATCSGDTRPRIRRDGKNTTYFSFSEPISSK